MPSIPSTMTWELLHRGRWSLPAAALGVVAGTAILFASLAYQGVTFGPADSLDSPNLILHMVVVQLNAAAFGMALASSQWQMGRLYVYPATTTTLVTWRLLPVMVLMFLESVAAITLLNALFHLDWPVWGPAFASAVGLALVMGAFWFTERSAWVVISLAIVGAIYGLWFRSRYGSFNRHAADAHFWTTITPGDALVLFVFAAAAFGIAIVGVGRNRRGDPPFSIGFLDWLTKVLDRPSKSDGRFASSAAAQFWLEYHTKGPIMTACVIIGFFIGMISWTFSGRHPEELIAGLCVGGWLLSLAGFIGGMVLAITGPRTGYVMGSFLATRPLTNVAMARALLLATARGLLVAWAIWAALFFAAYGAVRLAGIDASAVIENILSTESWWWYPLATLLAAWIVVGTTAAAGLTGRPRQFSKLICTLAAGFLGLKILASFALTPVVQGLLEPGVAGASGVALLIAVAWFYVAAYRQELVGGPIVVAAALVWLAILATFLSLLPAKGPTPIAGLLLIAGVLALAVAPPATYPLALAWNRTR